MFAELGECIGLDAATVKGVIDRLKNRGIIRAWTTVDDRRSRTVTLTAKGRQLFEKTVPYALEITSETLKPLNAKEQAVLTSLLKRLI